MKQAFLKFGKDDSLRRFHPWIFSGAIHHFSEQPEEGEVVEVYAAKQKVDKKGFDFEYIASGHFQIGSIMVRVLTFEHEDINQDFYEQRLASALQMRKAVGLVGREDSTSFRMVHGEGDNLPGLVIDVYKKTAVMQAHSVGMHVDRFVIAKALKNVMGDDLENIFYKSETTLPFKAELGQENGFLLGGSTDDIATENGLKFHVDWLRGQKTGFFVDQRENRSLLQKYSQGRKVLNMFCYTGGFSFYAMRGGAELVHSVDSSQKAIDLTNANVELNFPNDPRHKAYAEDAFKFLDRMEKGAYDLIILDPPAFVKHKDALRNALKGYSRLNQKAFEKIAKGGILFTFSC
ncbi:MAG: class I SAM-dependent rRNA methyltransferase, partial [Bacteroidaceae bacterium]|nr:class I SAM-dependent rRNA methyltransferase [Bacteroidaceae bacterium]